MIRNAAKMFLFVFTLMALMTMTSFAFPPSDAWTAILNSVAFLGKKEGEYYSHKSITIAALEEIYKELSFKQVSDVTDVIVGSNCDVDDDQESAWKHFDGESFDLAQNKLIELRSGIQVDMNKKDAHSMNLARIKLGQVLHSVQDFYSHSNWVELKNEAPHSSIGIPGKSINHIGLHDRACKNGKLFDEKGNLFTRELTSGYYKKILDSQKGIKCHHGGVEYIFLDSQGINKDSNNIISSPHARFHSHAAKLATKASVEFIRSLSDSEQFRTLFIPGNACEQRMKISMSSILDIHHIWSDMLKSWSADWIRESQNHFCLKVYPGGAMSATPLLASNEEERILERLKGEKPQLNLAIISTVGLVQFLDPKDRKDLHRISISGGLTTKDMNDLREKLEKKLWDKKIIVLSWNYMGKLRFFTKETISQFDEFRKKNIWVGRDLSNAFKTAIGSKSNSENITVSSASSEIADLAGLLEQKKSDIFLQMILPHQALMDSSFMIDFDWATMTSATIVKSSQWHKLPPDLQNSLKTLLIKKANNISEYVQQMEDLRVKILQQNGKIIHIPDARKWEDFRDTVVRFKESGR